LADHLALEFGQPIREFRAPRQGGGRRLQPFKGLVTEGKLEPASFHFKEAMLSGGVGLCLSAVGAILSVVETFTDFREHRALPSCRILRNEARNGYCALVATAYESFASQK
jgi:hypothetical protein